MEQDARQGDAVGCVSRKPARSSSGGRHSRPGQRSCKACGLTRLPSGYNEKYRICKVCYLAPQLCVGGEQLRFCQQCSKLQPLADFEGERRSCRYALERHAERRQHRAARAAARSASPQPQPRPTRRPRLEPPAQQDSPGDQKQQQQQQTPLDTSRQQQQTQQQQTQQQQQQTQQVQPVQPVQQEAAHAPSIHMVGAPVKHQAVPTPAVHVVPAPPADPEPAHVWPAELLQLAQQEQQARQRLEGQPPQLGGGGLGPGSLSLAVGHPTERLDITMSLEPWLQSQPAPCPEGSSAEEPAVSAREAWKESLAALPAAQKSPFQQAAPAAPATTYCSNQSAATVAGAGTTAATMLPMPSQVAAPLLMPAASGSGSGCLSASLTAHGSGLMAAPTVARTPFVARPDGQAMEVSGSNSFKFAAGYSPLGAANPAPQLQAVALTPAQLAPTAAAPTAAPTPQQLGWVRQPAALPSPPMEALGRRSSSNWSGWL